ncbi:MAG: LysE family transporter [Bacteroidia bacterium]|nr:LysE family transporter [Bacteroidia bacterium]
MAFLQGYLAGLALVVLIGPVLFVLIQSTLQYGKASGFMVAFGIFVSDIIAVVLCTYGAGNFFQHPASQFWLAMGSSIILLGFGLKYLLSPSMKDPGELKITRKGLIGFFLKGFAVNFINPFVFMVWLGIIGMAETTHGAGEGLFLFLTGTLLGILTLDTAKVFLAHKIRPLLQPKILKVIFRISGGLLAVSGFYVLYVAFFKGF